MTTDGWTSRARKKRKLVTRLADFLKKACEEKKKGEVE